GSNMAGPFLIRAWRDVKLWLWEQADVLAGQKHYATGHQQGSYPAPMIDMFVQEYLRSCGIGYEGEGRGCRSHQAYVAPRQGKQQAEERGRHHENTQHKAGTPQDSPCHR